MPRPICFLLFVLCALPVAGYTAEEKQKEVLIPIDILQCLYEKSEKLLRDSETSLITVRLSNQCDRIAAQSKSPGTTRSSPSSIDSSINQNGENTTFKADDEMLVTSDGIVCLNEAYEKSNLDSTANPGKLDRNLSIGHCLPEMYSKLE